MALSKHQEKNSRILQTSVFSLVAYWVVIEGIYVPDLLLIFISSEMCSL